MSHLFRLIKILNVAASYRLYEFLDQQRSISLLRMLLKIYGIPWFLSKNARRDKNSRLRLAMQELGPIYIKFGQLLSTRRDFLDSELADELQCLQDNVPPFTSPTIKEVVELSLGTSVASVFSELDSQPLASASVAQVHAGRLKTGEEVVVKVIRPGIEKTITADLKLLKWAARLVETHLSIGKRLKAIEVIDDYEKIIFDELNLLIEAANTTQLRRNFSDFAVLYVPKIHWDYCRSNIMVMERIYGIPISDIAGLEKNKVNLKKLAETGVEIFFTQVFDHAYFHADMHPGNIFVAENKPDQPQYIAIDCAIIGSLNDDDQQYLAKNLLAIFKRDYRKVAKLHVECGWVPPDTKIHEFETTIRSVCEPIFEKPLKDISFGQLLVQLFRTAGRFNMEVQPSLVLLQKTLLNVEGLGRQLYPELDLWQTALPFLENWNSKRLNPFTLLSRIQENVPGWIEQLPELPKLVIDAATNSRQLEEINRSLVKKQQSIEKELARQRVRTRNSGLAALLFAALLLYPPLSTLVSNLPILAVGLAVVGVYLLYFKR
ncbi:MAG: ubiquinone biosynthesis regulatory protein kinase UbiB [Gammaproteobacteria bacterium]|nr:ubiquinone biosynthesis regulatory protein kinase UbiB [Gammaproteobacteria bacterium]MDP6096834.1 ubiquinone biosynthesis regulatory protein kinase UbiB [Gammaproteobacteria bacterium]